MQTSGLKRARSPDDVGACCNGTRSAKAARRGTGDGRGGGTSGRGVGTSGRGIGTSGRGVGTSGRGVGTSGRGIGTSGRGGGISGRGTTRGGRGDRGGGSRGLGTRGAPGGGSRGLGTRGGPGGGGRGSGARGAPGGGSRGSGARGAPGGGGRGGGAQGGAPVCFRCGQPGHLQKDCPEGTPVCYNCGQTGHLVSACKTPRCGQCGVLGHEGSNCPGVTAALDDDDDMDLDKLQIDDDNNNKTSIPPVTVGLWKIRNVYAAHNVNEWKRDKIILYLPNLPKVTSLKLEDNKQIMEKAMEELKKAFEWPAAVMDLTELGADSDCTRVLGNEDAGRLFQALHSTHKNLLTSRTSTSRILNQAMSRLTVAKSSKPNGGRMWESLNRLAPDMDKSGWIWDLLRQTSRSWMDTRFRVLRNAERYDDDGNFLFDGLPSIEAPVGLGTRVDLVNAMIHGGNLRLDALMCQLRFGSSRYLFDDYDPYMEACFLNYYGMTSEVGIWLCKSLAPIAPYHRERFIAVPRETCPTNLSFIKSAEHGSKQSNGVDWSKYIFAVNVYAYARDQVKQNLARNYSGFSVKDIHEKLFTPFVNSLIALIDFAKLNPDSNASQGSIAAIELQHNTLEGICQLWTDPQSRAQNDSGDYYQESVWHQMDKYKSWTPAKDVVQRFSFDHEKQQIWTLETNPPPAPQPLTDIGVTVLQSRFGSGLPPGGFPT